MPGRVRREVRAVPDAFIGRRIAEERHKKKLGQREFAAKLTTLSATQLARVEQGKRPIPNNELREVAAALEVEIGELMRDPLYEQLMETTGVGGHFLMQEAIASTALSQDPTMQTHSVGPDLPVLRQAREAKELTQKQVSERLGIHSGYYSRMEQGYRPIPEPVRLDLLELLGEFTLPERRSEYLEAQRKSEDNEDVPTLPDMPDDNDPEVIASRADLADRFGVPTNEQLFAKGKELDPAVAIRNWIDRHVPRVPEYGSFDTRDEWLNWASQNLWNDPEFRGAMDIWHRQVITEGVKQERDAIQSEIDNLSDEAIAEVGRQYTGLPQHIVDRARTQQMKPGHIPGHFTVRLEDIEEAEHDTELERVLRHISVVKRYCGIRSYNTLSALEEDLRLRRHRHDDPDQQGPDMER